MEVVILTETEIRDCVSCDKDAIEAIEAAFSRLADGRVTMPPILRVDIPEHGGEVDVKTAVIRDFDEFAIKVSSGFFGNRRLGLPSGSGLMLLVSATTGVPKAVLLDNGYLTDVRTAAAGAVAADYLAPKGAENVGAIGVGAQARFQMSALRHVRPFKRLRAYGPTPDRVEAYVQHMRAALPGVDVSAAASAEQVVKESEVVVTTTPSTSPIVKAEWLHPGLHLTAVGADAEHKQELDAHVFARADRIACDVMSQCARLGEIHHAMEAGILRDGGDPVVELGAITSGREPGRTSERDVTVCDLTGTGAQDTAIALLAARTAADKGLGFQVDMSGAVGRAGRTDVRTATGTSL